MTTRMALLAAAVLVLALMVSACGSSATTESEPGAAATGWQALLRAPLSPRENAVGLWTGKEVLLIGGSDATPCPPNASCVPPDRPPLADGAAFDPEHETWRPIAIAPRPFEWAQGFVLGETAYLWIPGTPGRPKAERAFLASRSRRTVGMSYRCPEARATLITQSCRPASVSSPIGTATSRANSRISSSTPPPGRGASCRPTRSRRRSYFAWTGKELILFDHELVANPGSDAPAITRAAAFDVESGSWRRLPDSKILATGPWVVTGHGRLVNPTTGGADGGEVNNWGRFYPLGGILDVVRGEWSDLPRPHRDDPDEPAAGVLTDTGGHYFRVSGWVFDATQNDWIPIPALESDRLVTGRTPVAAGDDLIVFGGVLWDSSGTGGELSNDAFVWSPRS